MQTEESLRLKKKFSDTVIESTPGVFYVINTQGNYVRWNSYLNRLTGFSDEVLRQDSVLEHVHVDDRSKVAAMMKEAIATGYAQVEARLLSRDRGPHDFFLTNRRFGHPFSLMMLDIDHFKNLNDQHGHPAGDLVLQMLTKECKRGLRDIDMLGRLGGEEFAIFLPENDARQAHKVATRLCKRISEIQVPLKQGQQIQFTISIGVASLCDADKDIDMLLGRADHALYQAKQTGRNRVCRAEENNQ